MPPKWETASRYASLLSTTLALVSFFFPRIPDEVRYVLLGIALVGAAGLAVRPLLPLDRYRIAYEANAQTYGFRYERLHVRTVLSQDGSAIVSRTVKVVGTSAELAEVHHYLMVPGSREDAQSAQSVGVAQLSCDDPRRVVAVEKVNSPEGNSRFKVKISPALARGGDIEYMLEETVPPASFAVTRDQLQPGFPYEYVAWEVSRPTKELVLETEIPLALGTQMHNLDVWRGTEYGHDTLVSEFDRVKPEWKEDTRYLAGEDYHRLVLKVRFPILGMRYVTKWTPVVGPKRTLA